MGFLGLIGITGLYARQVNESAWLGLAGYLVFAIFWAFTSSFKDLTEIFRYPPQFLPRTFYLTNYINLLTKQFFPRWFLNSVMLSLTNTFLVVFFCSLAAFAFAKYQFKYKNALFAFLMGSLIIPFSLIMTPLYAEMNKLKWLNSYWALVVPWIAPAFGIFLLRQYMITIPTELIDAARIDGCSEFRIYYQIIVPLSRPALGTLAIYQFMNSWNSFLWPLIVLREQRLYTLPIGLATLLGNMVSETVDYGMVMAGAFLTALPIIIVFLFMQRQFISGLTLGSVKG
jgi:ABC-type glycerol-3-phosphate transport system permease component